MLLLIDALIYHLLVPVDCARWLQVVLLHFTTVFVACNGF